MRDSDWEILDELYRNPNMSRAATALYMSQPSLTKRLQRMEAELGVQIADRTPHGLEFTEEGHYLCKRAAEHLAFVEETFRGLEDIKASASHVITIGSSYTFNRYGLWDVLSGYSKLDAGVRFNTLNELSNKLYKMLLDGQIDVAFVRGDYDNNVEKILVDKSQAYLVTSNPVDFEQLPNMCRIDYRTSPFTTSLIEDWWKDHYGTSMPQGTSMGYIDFSWSQVAENDNFYMLSFIPKGFENTYNLTLTPLTMSDTTPVVRNSWCIYQESRSMPAHLRAFIEYVAKEAPSLVEGSGAQL